MFSEFVAWVDALTPTEFEQLRQGYRLVWAELDHSTAYMDMMLIKDATDVRSAREQHHAEAVAECVLSFSNNRSIAESFPDCTEDHVFSVARDMIARAVSLTKWHDLAVAPPVADGIKAVRQAVGTQALCAALSGVNLSNWQRWEKGETSPHPSIWGAFLLSIGQHPRYSVSAK